MRDKPLPYYQMRCPRCGGLAEAEFVDVGVGIQQASPFACRDCNWAEDTDLDLQC